MSEDRLNRIEEKLDRLVDVVESIARVEEKILASNMRLDRTEHRLDKNEKDINALANMVRDNTGVATFASKAFWLVVGGMVSLAVWAMKSGVSA